MKVQVKIKEEWNPQLYKFRTRAFKIENVMEFTAHPLGLSVASDTYLEWQEFMAEEESNEKVIIHHCPSLKSFSSFFNNSSFLRKRRF